MAHIAEDMRALRKTFPRGIFTSAKDRATLSDRKLVRFDVPAAALTSITSYYIGNAAPDPVWLETTGGPQCAGFFRYVRATFMTATGLSVDYSMFNGVGLKFSPVSATPFVIPLASCLNGFANVTPVAGSALTALGGGTASLMANQPWGNKGDRITLVNMTGLTFTIAIAGALIVELIGGWDTDIPDVGKGTDPRPCCSDPNCYNGPAAR
jgi:hypothetical protein